MKIEIKKLCENAKIPVYATENSAGADLYACEQGNIEILPHKTVAIHTGIALAIPAGYVGLIYARSGMALKRNLAPANKVGVIDADYRGEIIVALHNHGEETQVVEAGDRIAQLVIAPVSQGEFELVNELDETKRGTGGFGSTGKN